MQKGVDMMTKFKWWFSWNSDAFELYLEDMAAKGYVLDQAYFALMQLSFKEEEPQNIRYCVDYNNKYTREYEILLEDDGWICKGSSSGWRIWAKAYEGHRPDLFSDKISIIERNQRLLSLLFIILMAQLPVAVINYSSISQSSKGLWSPFGMIVGILYTFVLVMLIYSIIKIWRYNYKLK